MNRDSQIRTIISFLLMIALIIGLSLVSSFLWGGRSETLPDTKALVIQDQMTIKEFGRANDFPNPVLKSMFELKVSSDLEKKLSQYGSPDQIRSLVRKKLALAAEHATKNWVKIPVKFGLWFAFLITTFLILRKRTLTQLLRKWMLFISVLIFGVIMGSDPSPMGTVKDAIHLCASVRAVFPPRMIALAVFLAIVFLANKYICAWGCQAGVLQDLIFRLNRNRKRKAIVGKQLKLPFVLTNTVRVVFLGAFSIAAFAWSGDIIEPVDPFKIFKPAYLGLAGSVLSEYF
jgi:hypothetical protein